MNKKSSNENNVKFSKEQIKMIWNAIDLKEVKKLIKEDNYNFRRFCLTEDYPRSLYQDRIAEAVRSFYESCKSGL